MEGVGSSMQNDFLKEEINKKDNNENDRNTNSNKNSSKEESKNKKIENNINSRAKVQKVKGKKDCIIF